MKRLKPAKNESKVHFCFGNVLESMHQTIWAIHHFKSLYKTVIMFHSNNYSTNEQQQKKKTIFYDFFSLADYTDAVNTLLGFGADVNLANNDGQTPLHTAAKNNGNT